MPNEPKTPALVLKTYIQCSGGSRISRSGMSTSWEGGGAWTPKAVMFQTFLYVKTKESGPLGGCAPGTPPRSANAVSHNELYVCKFARFTMFVKKILSTSACS